MNAETEKLERERRKSQFVEKPRTTERRVYEQRVAAQASENEKLASAADQSKAKAKAKASREGEGEGEGEGRKR